MNTTTYEWAQWRHLNECEESQSKCMHCQEPAVHIAFAKVDEAFDNDWHELKALCDEHYTTLTQRQWMKKWRKINLPINHQIKSL